MLLEIQIFIGWCMATRLKLKNCATSGSLSINCDINKLKSGKALNMCFALAATFKGSANFTQSTFDHLSGVEITDS